MKFGRKDYDERIVDTKGEIPEDEPVFFLRGKDPLAPKILLQYATELRLAGGNPFIADSAIQHAQRMLDYQRVKGFRMANSFDNGGFDNLTLAKITNMVEKLDDVSDKDLDQLTENKGFPSWVPEMLETFLKIVPDGDNNVIYLTNVSLKEESYNKRLKDLSLSDFNIDEDTFLRSSMAKYIVFVNYLTKAIHFLKR